MQPDDKSRELKQRITSLPDEKLLEMVEVEARDYTEAALEFAKAELLARGIEFDEAPVVDEEDDLEEELTAREVAPDAIACSKCGGETRPGILFAHREITMVFSDKKEERFVEVYACWRCGRVEMAVDYDTDVER